MTTDDHTTERIDFRMAKDDGLVATRYQMVEVDGIRATAPDQFADDPQTIRSMFSILDDHIDLGAIWRWTPGEIDEQAWLRDGEIVPAGPRWKARRRG